MHKTRTKVIHKNIVKVALRSDSLKKKPLHNIKMVICDLSWNCEVTPSHSFLVRCRRFYVRNKVSDYHTKEELCKEAWHIIITILRFYSVNFENLRLLYFLKMFSLFNLSLIFCSKNLYILYIVHCTVHTYIKRLSLVRLIQFGLKFLNFSSMLKVSTMKCLLCKDVC